MTQHLIQYKPGFTVPLSGASQGVIDLGVTSGRKVILQADLRTNSTYTLYWFLSPFSAALTESADHELLSDAPGLAFDSSGLGGDSIDIASADSDDDVQWCTLYGTTEGDTTTLVTETIQLTGTTPVETTKDDWGVLLGITLEFPVIGATIDFTDHSGSGAIISIAEGDSASGVASVTGDTQRCYGHALRLLPDDATTKLIGLVGTSGDGYYSGEVVTLVDEVTPSFTARGFDKLTKVLVGDLEDDRTLNVDLAKCLMGCGGSALTAYGADSTFSGNRYLHWALYDGTTLAAAGANDYLKVSLEG